MKRKTMKWVCLSLTAFMMAAAPLSATAAMPNEISRAENRTYKPYNSDLHEVYLNGKYQYREAHTWQYSGTMVYCTKCGVYK